MEISLFSPRAYGSFFFFFVFFIHVKFFSPLPFFIITFFQFPAAAAFRLMYMYGCPFPLKLFPGSPLFAPHRPLATARPRPHTPHYIVTAAAAAVVVSAAAGRLLRHPRGTRHIRRGRTIFKTYVFY